MAIIGLLALLILGLVVIVGIVAWMTYNKLVTLRNRYSNAFAQIDVQLKRRYDLIPNLVETAKGYLKHERETLEAVILARNQAYGAVQAASANPGSADAMKALGSAEGVLSGALGRLMMVSEAYPDLKADASMNRVMEELTSTENRISFARQSFNDAVTLYNTSREVFPAVVFAGMFNFQGASLLEFERERTVDAPKVSFT